jgi:bifunctional UDP-N-acetylglucosamine pyrophosphorylase / glucosamine-1-phosphate N-acetyltransferase
VVNKNVPPGKLAVGMPARVIRDAPGQVSEDREKNQDERQRPYKTEG